MNAFCLCVLFMTPCQNVANYRIVPLDMYEYILALETISWWCTYYVYTLQGGSLSLYRLEWNAVTPPLNTAYVNNTAFMSFCHARQSVVTSLALCCWVWCGVVYHNRPGYSST